jgi:DNA-binding NarL/FixJ family response regulator
MTVRLFIVDDHDLFRSGVRAELGDGVDVVGEASQVEAAVELINERIPDVVLLDVHMPAGGGKAVIEGVKEKHPEVEFLALSASDAAEDVVAIVRAGARGYVTKTISAKGLASAIARVAGGHAVFSPQLAGFVLEAFSSIPVSDVDPDLDQLTRREREVLQHLARAYTYREIADRLFISVKTVETHASNVLRKLQLSSRYELTIWAHDRKLI